MRAILRGLRAKSGFRAVVLGGLLCLEAIDEQVLPVFGRTEGSGEELGAAV